MSAHPDSSVGLFISFPEMKTTDTTAIERDHIIRSLQGSDWKIIRAVGARQQDRTLEFMMLVT